MFARWVDQQVKKYSTWDIVNRVMQFQFNFNICTFLVAFITWQHHTAPLPKINCCRTKYCSTIWNCLQITSGLAYRWMNRVTSSYIWRMMISWSLYSTWRNRLKCLSRRHSSSPSCLRIGATSRLRSTVRETASIVLCNFSSILIFVRSWWHSWHDNTTQLRSRRSIAAELNTVPPFETVCRLLLDWHTGDWIVWRQVISGEWRLVVASTRPEQTDWDVSSRRHSSCLRQVRASGRPAG